MKYLAYALVLMFGFALAAVGQTVTQTGAQDSEVKLNVTWSFTGTPKSFILYLCDKPIVGEWSGNPSDTSLIGRCDGDLVQKTIAGTQRQAVLAHTVKEPSGTIYARMSTLTVKNVGGINYTLESDLSEQSTVDYKPHIPDDVDREKPPVIIDFHEALDIIIR